MGQAESSTNSQVITAPDENSTRVIQEFNTLSKSGVGVHMFSFTPPAALSNEETIYIGSEVTDENDILDVKYTLWKKEYIAATASPENQTALKRFTRPESKLKVIWKPVYHFSSGRLAMVAVKSLLNRGYKMQVCQPEQQQ